MLCLSSRGVGYFNPCKLIWEWRYENPRDGRNSVLAAAPEIKQESRNRNKLKPFCGALTSKLTATQRTQRTLDSDRIIKIVGHLIPSSCSGTSVTNSNTTHPYSQSYEQITFDVCLHPPSSFKLVNQVSEIEV